MKMFNKKIINLGSLVLLSALVLVMLNGAMHVQAADVSGNGGGGSSSCRGSKDPTTRIYPPCLLTYPNSWERISPRPPTCPT